MGRWVWISIAALIFANFVFHVVLLAAAQFLGPYGGAANIQSEESLAQREYAKHGGEGYTNVNVQLDEVQLAVGHCQVCGVICAGLHLQVQLAAACSGCCTAAGVLQS